MVGWMGINFKWITNNKNVELEIKFVILWQTTLIK